MFINLSNHPSVRWTQEQYEAAGKYGEVVDIPFPSIEANGTTEYFDEMVEAYVGKVLELDSDPVVMVQGEFVFTFRIVNKLKEKGIICLAAETKREVKEETDAEGNQLKTSVFKFEQFMEY